MKNPADTSKVPTGFLLFFIKYIGDIRYNRKERIHFTIVFLVLFKFIVEWFW